MLCDTWLVLATLSSSPVQQLGKATSISPLAIAQGYFNLLSCLASELQAPHAGHSLTMSLCFIPNSLARQRTLEDEEEQQRERRRRHRNMLSSTSTDEEPPSPVKDTSPASSRCGGPASISLTHDADGSQLAALFFSILSQSCCSWWDSLLDESGLSCGKSRGPMGL